MEFTDLENGIINYIKNNLPDYIAAANLSKIENYIDDVIDLDRYRERIAIFFDFTEYHFEPLTLDSREVTNLFHIYLILRNDTPENLKKNLRLYTTYIYNFYYANDLNRTFGGLIDLGIIQDVEIFTAFAGNVNIKIVDFTFKITLEDNLND